MFRANSLVIFLSDGAHESDRTFIESPRQNRPDITRLPMKESDLPEWQTAIDSLMLVSRSGPAKLARIAFIQALDRNVVLKLTPINGE